MKFMENKSQKGGLLVEALAILGIVAVTSPMIYKKKIDKAQELEDIAKASQMRIIKEAVGNFVDAKYQDYKVADGSTDVRKEVLTLDAISEFLPPGFENDNTVKIGIRGEKVGNEDRVSAIIIDGEKYGEKRGNRIASLIGADGGYAGMDGQAVGNNSVWTIDPADYGFNKNEVKAQLVSTTQFGKSAASGEYLYKYKIEGQPQVNMMMTDIKLRGNDLNNTSSVGMVYGKDDKFNAWQLNGNKGEQYGDGTIIGKNKEGYDSVVFQSNRTANTELTGSGKDLLLKNGEAVGREDKDPTKDGYGAMVLRSVKGGKSAGCVEALANSDIKNADGSVIGNEAGIFTACNNNSARTAYLIANGSGNAGELRVRQNGNEDAGATVYADKDGKTASFEVTESDGNLTGAISSDKVSSVNLFFKGTTDKETNSVMELSSVDRNSGATLAANSKGGFVNLSSNNNETVRMIGEESTVVVTDQTKGNLAAGITGKNQKNNDVHDGYVTGQLVLNKDIEARLTENDKNPALTGGALFVRGKNGKTDVIVSGTSKDDKSGLLTMGYGTNRNVLISSENGSSLSLADDGMAKVTVEGDRKSGAVNGVSSITHSKSGYFEVIGGNNVEKHDARAEMYASLSGKLKKDAISESATGFDQNLGAFYSGGNVSEDTNGGGAYLAYNKNVGTVKIMANAGYDGNAKGGTIELTPFDNGNDKAIITTAMHGETENNNIGAVARLSAGEEQYAHFGANGKNNAGEMILKSSSGKIEAMGNENIGGSMYFKHSENEIGVAMRTDTAQNGNVKVYDTKGDRVEVGVDSDAPDDNNNVKVMIKNEEGKKNVVLDDKGLTLKNGEGDGKVGVEFKDKDLRFYNPDEKKAVFADTVKDEATGEEISNFQVGQNNVAKVEMQGESDSVAAMNAGMTTLIKKSDDVIKGALLIRNTLDAVTITAPVVKTTGNMNFSDICILGKEGYGDDSPCLSDAAAYHSKYKDWKLSYGDLSVNAGKSSSNFGRALWQLVYDRVVDFLESSEHNDTHHLKTTWGDKVEVGGRKISIGDAYHNGNNASFEYLNEDASYNYMSSKEDNNSAKNATLNIGYFNIENNKKEEINTGLLSYNDYNQYPERETQFSAAGHHHGAASVFYNSKYPTFKGGTRGYDLAPAPQEEKLYAARGHYHLNYNADSSGCKNGKIKILARRIKTGKVCSTNSYDGGNDCVEEKEVTISCAENLSGKGSDGDMSHFYQGMGTSGVFPSTEWNTAGERMEDLVPSAWGSSTRYY